MVVIYVMCVPLIRVRTVVHVEFCFLFIESTHGEIKRYRLLCAVMWRAACVHSTSAVTFCILQSRALAFDLSLFSTSSYEYSCVCHFKRSYTHHNKPPCLQTSAFDCRPLFLIPFCNFLAPLVVRVSCSDTAFTFIYVLFFYVALLVEIIN